MKSAYSKVKTIEEFQQAIKDHGKLIVITTANWCGPCQELKRILPKMLEDWKEEIGEDIEVRLMCFDTDRMENYWDATAESYKVQAFPTMLLFRDGKHIRNIAGLRNKPTMKKNLMEAFSS